MNWREILPRDLFNFLMDYLGKKFYTYLLIEMKRYIMKRTTFYGKAAVSFSVASHKFCMKHLSFEDFTLKVTCLAFSSYLYRLGNHHIIIFIIIIIVLHS